MPLLAHPQRVLRQTVGTNIAAIVEAGGLAGWPELIGLLMQCLTSQDPAATDGALDTLFKASVQPAKAASCACRGLQPSVC